MVPRLNNAKPVAALTAGETADRATAPVGEPDSARSRQESGADPPPVSPTAQEIDELLQSLLGSSVTPAPQSDSDPPDQAVALADAPLNAAAPVNQADAVLADTASSEPGHSADRSDSPVAPANAPLNTAAPAELPDVLGAGWSKLDTILDENLEEYLVDSTPEPILIWPLVLTAIALFLVLTGGLTLYIRTLQVNVQAELAAQQSDANSLLKESIAFIQEADVVVIGVDKALDNQVTASNLPDLESLIGQVDGAQQNLSLAIERAESAKAIFTSPADQQIAQYAIDAAQFRQQMLVLGVQLIQADISAMQSAIQLETVWENINDANTLMRDAAALSASVNTAQINQALTMNSQAADLLTSAQSALTTAAALFASADFSSLQNYLTVKQESVQLAMAFDQSLLAKDYSTARQQAADSNQKEAEAVELAKLIPDDPYSIIVDAYNAQTNDWRNAYQELFSQAADTDVHLRNWLAGSGAAASSQ